MIFQKVDKKLKDIVFVYTTCHSLDEVKSLGYGAVEGKLAISADYWLIGSIYPWKKVLQEVDQYMLMLTTEKFLNKDLMSFIENNHSYTVPIVFMNETSIVNPNYSFWVDTVLNENDKYVSGKEAEIIKKEEKDHNVYHYGKLK